MSYSPSFAERGPRDRRLRLRARRLMARPSSQMGFLWRGSAPPDRAGSDSVIARAVARVVSPFSVNERLKALGGPIRPPV
jgi:hypothetical protein